MQKRFFHYTAEDRLETILDSEHIKVATANLPKKVKPAAWFSTNETWEHTATKFAMNERGELTELSLDEMIEMCGLARIEIEPTTPLITWAKYRHESGMSVQLADELETIGRKKGASPGQWYTSFRPVSIDYWIRAEVWRNGKWVEYEVFTDIE